MLTFLTHQIGQKTTYWFIVACIKLWATGKTLYHTEKQGFGYLWLSKKFQTHPPKPAEVEPYICQRWPCIPPAGSLDSYHNILPPILASKVTLSLLPTCTILPFPKDLVDHCQQRDVDHCQRRGEQAAAEHNHSHTHTVEHAACIDRQICFASQPCTSDVSLKASMLDCTQSSTSGHAFTVQYRGCCHRLWPCHEIKNFVRAARFFQRFIKMCTHENCSFVLYCL